MLNLQETTNLFSTVAVPFWFFISNFIFIHASILISTWYCEEFFILFLNCSHSDKCVMASKGFHVKGPLMSRHHKGKRVHFICLTLLLRTSLCLNNHKNTPKLESLISDFFLLEVFNLQRVCNFPDSFLKKLNVFWGNIG